MSVREAEETPVWTIAEAKAKLSEILRLAESEGPQRIGRRKRYVVVPEEVWLERESSPQAPQDGASEDKSAPRMSIGQYLIEKMPRGIYDNAPERGSDPPYSDADWSEGQWATLDGADPDNK